MTTTASLNDRLSENAGGLTKFVALHGSKIGMSVALISGIGVMAGAAAFAVTSDPQYLLNAFRFGVGGFGSGLIFAGTSKLTNLLARESNPEWFRDNNHEKDGVTTIEPGPSASMEAKALFSRFSDSAKSKFVEIARGTPLETIIPKALLDNEKTKNFSKDSSNNLSR